MNRYQPGVLALRPATVGELLDSAVALLRSRFGLLIGLGLLAAAAEQAVLFPLRRLADLDYRYLPADDRWPVWTLLVAVGFASEVLIITGLGGVAAAATPRALLGPAAPRPERPARPALTVAAVAGFATVVVGVVVFTTRAWPLTFFMLAPFTLLGWCWLYGSLGPLAPVVVIERLGPAAAMRRAIGLAQRGVLRVVRVRVMGYLGWFLIRLAWGFGVMALIRLAYTPPDTTMDNVVMAAVYFGINALAYPMLACLDVMLYVDVRMRTEGLDIALRRSLHRGVDATAALVGR